MLKAKLVVVGGDAKSKEVNLRLPCVIGRGREATLTLPHPLVSRQHTEIFERDGKLFVRDLDSLNGTFLNNKKLESEQPLEPNQLLTLGNVTFRAVYEVGEVGEATSASDTAEIGDTIESDAEMVTLPPNNETVFQDSLFEKETVYDPSQEPNASDTDKSSLSDVVDENGPHECDVVITGPVPEDAGTSDIFTGVDSGEKQQSAVSSLGGLPETAAAMSFKAGIDLGDDAGDQKVAEAVDIEIADEHRRKEADDSGLDSFIKRLPK